MQMPFYVSLYVITLVTFLAIDFIWLGLVAQDFYRRQLGFLLAEQPNWWAAAAFYALFVAGVVVFAIVPALSEGSIWKAIALGAFFGLVTYATYDLTNQATVKNWPRVVTAVDLAWGVFIASSVSCVGFLAGQWLERPPTN
jgi:uncharacterized membrane protein